MHRDPPRHGARRNISMRSSRRWASGWRRPRSAIPRAEDTRMGALVSVSQRDDVRAEDRASWKRPARGSSPAIPNAEPPIAGGAFLPPVLLRTDDPWGNDAVHDCEPFGPVSTIMPYKDIADAIALANRGRAAWCCRCSPTRPTRRASSSRARPPITAGCWSSTAPTPPNRPATARRCRCWSTAAPAAPAAARRWAACAA